jgi:hypothetical protein
MMEVLMRLGSIAPLLLLIAASSHAAILYDSVFIQRDVQFQLISAVNGAVLLDRSNSDLTSTPATLTNDLLWVGQSLFNGSTLNGLSTTFRGDQIFVLNSSGTGDYIGNFNGGPQPLSAGSGSTDLSIQFRVDVGGKYSISLSRAGNVGLGLADITGGGFNILTGLLPNNSPASFPPPTAPSTFYFQPNATYLLAAQGRFVKNSLYPGPNSFSVNVVPVPEAGAFILLAGALALGLLVGIKSFMKHVAGFGRVQSWASFPLSSQSFKLVSHPRQNSSMCFVRHMGAFECLESRVVLNVDFSIANSVIPAAPFNWYEFSKDGAEAQLLWNYKDNMANLVYRSRSSSSLWIEQVVDSEPIVGSSPDRTNYFADGRPAQLIFAADSSPTVLLSTNFGTIDVYRRSGETWSVLTSIAIPAVASRGWFGSFNAAYAADGSISFVFTDTTNINNFQPGDARLYHATNKSGNWVFTKVTDIGDPAAYRRDFVGRPISFAIDSLGFSHIAYTPAFNAPLYGQYNRPYSELAYATNRTTDSSWTTQIVLGTKPADDSADSGLGASLAIGPGDQISIASFFLDRVPTGSPSSAQLLFHTRLSNGTWTREVVASNPAGYQAGDGPLGTGVSPDLVFRPDGKPLIVFSDFAGQHFAQFGAIGFAGQIRQAVKNNGAWALSTVFAQSDPLRNQMIYPTIAVSADRTVYAGLRQRDTVSADGASVRNSDFFLETISSFPGPSPNGNSRLLAVGSFSQGVWQVDSNNNGSFESNDFSIVFGVAGDVPVWGDWTGSGRERLGVFRRGTWYLDTNGQTGWQGTDTSIAFGVSGDIPVVGDWTGTGKTCIGVFRNGFFYLDTNGVPGWQANDTTIRFGVAGDIPVAGDWSGDGKDKIGTVRGTQWFLDSNGTPGWQGNDTIVNFGVGSPTDTPVIGDWNGDGKDEIGVYRRSGQWFLDSNGILGWQPNDRTLTYDIGSSIPIVRKGLFTQPLQAAASKTSADASSITDAQIDSILSTALV